MIRICPSILNADQDQLADEIEKVRTSADFIHLDIMDNKFVPNFTYNLARTREIVQASSLPIDLHLMVEEADHWGPRYAAMKDEGVFSVTVHFEATRDLSRTLREIAEHGVRRGVAIKPKTEAEVLFPTLAEIDMVLVMTVEPGFGGQSFMAEMMPKVSKIRARLTEMGRETCWIQVDGGIALSTIGEAAFAGADTFVAGSAVYRSDDPSAMVRELRARAEVQ